MVESGETDADSGAEVMMVVKGYSPNSRLQKPRRGSSGAGLKIGERLTV
jgi:hypothetical protein